MATQEERLRILKMIEEGKISAEDGARLLEALSSAEQRRAESPASPATARRWFRVRVSDRHTGKNKVNVTIPVGLVDVGLKMGARFAPDIEGIDFGQISEMVRSGATGKLFEVEDVKGDERVEIFIE